MHVERFLRRSGLIDWDGDLLARSRLARRALVAMWEPVGVPSLGIDAWTAQFGRLPGNARFRARIEGMDRVVDSIPHLDGLHLMETFLRERASTG